MFSSGVAPPPAEQQVPLANHIIAPSGTLGDVWRHIAEPIRTQPDLQEAFTRSVPELQPHGHEFLADLNAFLDRYGHWEAGGTSQVWQSTWKDSLSGRVGNSEGTSRRARGPPDDGAKLAEDPR
jgi:hypothetical protein